jgi:hypothetical protein
MGRLTRIINKLRGLLLLMLVGFSARIALGQEFTGRVSDPSGAAVPKARITVHNLLTNDVISTQTNETGVYTVPYLNPGQYSVRASAVGFDTLVKNNITLEVGKTGVVDFVLKIGSVATTVTVEANVALDMGKADRGEVVENTRVTELPLNGRDPEMLTILNAGVTWTGSPQWQRPFDSTQSNTSINGGGNGNNVLQIDGVSNDSGNGNGIVGYVPPVDAVQEFKIITNPYDAQYGRGQGGVEDVTLKSGTNKLHGDVYEFARRSWLDADTWRNDWVNGQNPGSSPKGQHKLDQYGAELDGPVVLPHLYNGRDKSFFVVQFENWNEEVPSTMVTSVPDPKWLTGDFSNLSYWNGSSYAPVTVYDPLTLHADGSGNLVRDPFPGNIIPSGRINQVAQTLLSYYPKPNLTPPSGTNPFANNYATQNPTTDLYRNVLGKWDQNIGQKDRLAIRFGYWERWEVRSENGMPGLAKSGAEPFGQHGPAFTTDWVHTFSPSLIFDLRGSVIVRFNGWNNGPQNFPMNSIGWSSSQLGTHMPYMNISEFAYLGNQGANIDVENSAALLPSVTWIKGNHTFHIGADLRDLQQARKSVEDGPNFWIDRQWTQSNYIDSQWTQNSGNSIASMLLGYATSGGTSTVAQAYWTRHYLAPFIQDDWKVTRKLTLNLGIRYDINTPVVERHNRVDYAFDTNAVNPVDALVNHSLIPGGGQVKGAVTFTGVNGNPRSYYAQNWTNIQPRVGFAYAMTDKMVLRGGFGEMFKNPIPGGNTLGWSSNTNFNSTYDGGKTPADTLSSPFPNGIVQPTGSSTGALTDLGQGPWFINPHYKTPGIWQYSFGLQQEFLKGDTVEISYVGSQGFNQDSSDNINHWDPKYVATCNIEMGGNRHICDDANPGYTTNPFQGIAAFAGSSYYNASTIQYGNLTRPYVAVGDNSEYQLNDGRTWYNSLQVTGVHRQGRNLTLHGTWTWSKLMDSGGYADQTYRVKARWIDGNDFTHRITLSGVYDLPVGRGRSMLGNINRIADAVIGGWELGSLYVYQTGNPWGAPSGLEYLHNAWVPRTNEHTSGHNTIRGVNGCVADTNGDTGLHTVEANNWTSSHTCSQFDLVVRPEYAATQNVTYTGIRIPSDHQFDTNLSKNFAIREDLKAQFRLEAFNTLNHPLWQEGYDGGANNSTFGTIPKGPWGQSNLPRQVQLALKLMW